MLVSTVEKMQQHSNLPLSPSQQPISTLSTTATGLVSLSPSQPHHVTFQTNISNSEVSHHHHPHGNLTSEEVHHQHNTTNNLDSRAIPSSNVVVIKNPYDTPTEENENTPQLDNTFSDQVKVIVPKATSPTQHHHQRHHHVQLLNHPLEHVDLNVMGTQSYHQESLANTSTLQATTGSSSAQLGDDKFSTKHTMTASTPSNSPFIRGGMNEFEQSGFHFGVPGTPSDSFRKRPMLNVNTVNPTTISQQQRANQIVLEPVPNVASSHNQEDKQSFTKKGSIKIHRMNHHKSVDTGSPMKIADEELKPFGTEITVDDDAEYSTEEEALVDTAPPLEHDDQSFQGNDTTPTFLRPSESMESISSLVMDPTYQPEILSDESMKKYIENELTAGGTSVIGHLLKSAHDAATKIEKKTGMSLKERIPHVFSSDSLGHKTKPFQFLKGSADTAAPILLPSQKRTLRSWFLKRSRNTMRFKKKEQKWRKENAKYIEDNDVETGANDFKFENDSTTGDFEEDNTGPIEVEKTLTWTEKVIASFKWFFTGKVDKIQSKILYKDLSDEDRKKVHSLLIGRLKY